MYETMRPTWVEVNLDTLLDNYRSLKRLSSGKTVIPVVKADAYGHGARSVTRHLHEHAGVRLFAVSLVEEALDLLELDLDIDILVMGPIKPDDLPAISKHGLIFTLSNQVVYNAVKASGLPLRFHVKIDSGMHRLGFSDAAVLKDIFLVSKETPHMALEGVFTHFATADSDEAYFMGQKKAFENLVNQLPYVPRVVHAANSSAVVKYEPNIPHTTHDRVGISLYGYSLEGRLHHIRPVMTFKTQVVDIKHLKPGDCLGYGITYRAEDEETIGILPVGYADGWVRRNQGGAVFINDAPYTIVGRVCMDMTFVKIDGTVNLYDEVTLFGPTHLDADNVAERLGTISYEVLCMVGKRVPRYYKTVRT